YTVCFSDIHVSGVILVSIGTSLELVASVINFGALIAFTFVNLSVIAYFVFIKHQYRTPRDVFHHIVLPLIGAGLTGLLWAFLNIDDLIGCVIWLAVGVIYLAFMTDMFRKSVHDLGTEEEIGPHETAAVPE